jgi:hypothetical protein
MLPAEEGTLSLHEDDAWDVEDERRQEQEEREEKN